MLFFKLLILFWLINFFLLKKRRLVILLDFLRFFYINMYIPYYIYTIFSKIKINILKQKIL